jgi:class 3 adenylate cyclase
MSDDPLVRKLSAILYADVADYSRLTGEDEEGTHRLLSEYLDLLSGHVDSNNGRVVHYAGDAVLAQFDTVVDAVSCGVDIQNDLHVRNEALPEERRVWFRIGVNLGDVIVDRDDIYGDGVNIAARLEGLADPGGICVSGTVHDALGSRLALGYAFMGEQQVKNIAQPVRTYRVIFDWTEPAKNPIFGEAVRSARRNFALFAGAATVVLAIAVTWWITGTRPVESAVQPPAPVSPPERTAERISGQISNLSLKRFASKLAPTDQLA